MTSLEADVDNIIEMRVPETETASNEHMEDTMFVALFSTPTAPHEQGERAGSIVPTAPLMEKMPVQGGRSGRIMRR